MRFIRGSHTRDARPPERDEGPALVEGLRGMVRKYRLVFLFAAAALVLVSDVALNAGSAKSPVLWTTIGAMAVLFVVLIGAVVVSERMRRFNQELEAKNRALEQETLAKTQILSTVSHELKTPLTSIVGYVERLLEQKETVGPLNERLPLVLSQLGFGNCLRKRLRLLPFFRSVDVGGWQPWDENGMWSGWKGKNETSWND